MRLPCVAPRAGTSSSCPTANGYWPDRGLAALVGGDGKRVLRLLAFVPVPLAIYDERLRPGFAVRRVPPGPVSGLAGISGSRFRPAHTRFWCRARS